MTANRHNNSNDRRRELARRASGECWHVRDLWRGDRFGWDGHHYRTHTCGICHERIETRDQASLDHVIPLSHGGTETRMNIRLTHTWCNNKRGNQLPLEIEQSA